MKVPSTNFLECVYVDQPTDLVKPHYQFLSEVGVLHSYIQPLSQHLNRIDVENWWCEVKNRAEYREFKNQLTNSSKFNLLKNA